MVSAQSRVEHTRLEMWVRQVIHSFIGYFDNFLNIYLQSDGKA